MTRSKHRNMLHKMTGGHFVTGSERESFVHFVTRSERKTLTHNPIKTLKSIFYIMTGSENARLSLAFHGIPLKRH